MSTRIRVRKALSLAVGAIVILFAIDALAQTIEAQTATMDPPATPTATAAVMATPPSDPDAERELRAAALRDHYVLGPLEIVAGATAAVIVPPAETPQPAASPAAAPQVNLVVNRGLTDAETNNITSPVNEPSVATRGQEVLMTANWYASFSNDGGTSFQYLNPSTTFPSVNGGFCCDQLALYDQGHDLMVWFLQYVKDSTGNTVRIAVASGNNIPTRQWQFYDFTPGDLGLSGVWFDYPAMAAGRDFLYITVNSFTISGNQFQQAIVLRIPLAPLAANQGFNYDFFTTNQFSLRPTQGATNTMFFASHLSNTTLRLFSWPESGTNITATDVPVQAWTFTGGSGWLQRFDPRITAGWRSGNQVGFGWTAAPDAVFPNNHVRVVVFDTATGNVVSQPHLWSNSVSFAYMGAAPNSDGDVGVSVSFGNGANVHPSHAVGVLGAAGPAWVLVTTASGTDEPSQNVWGDYQTVSQHGATGTNWVASGFTQQGGAGSGSVETRYVEFSTVTDDDDPVPVPPDNITIALDDPTRRLADGDTMGVSATVTGAGNSVAGVTVNFSSADTTRATVSPASSVTNAQGVASATVTGRDDGYWELTTTITATTSGGLTNSTTVKVPNMSLFFLALAIAGMLLIATRTSRAKAA